MNPPLDALGHTLAAIWAVHTSHFLNRLAQSSPAAEASPDQPEPLKIDHTAKLIWLEGVRISVLSKHQRLLLQLLYDNREQVYERDRLCQDVYAGELPVEEERVGRLDSLISRLRGKLEQVPHRRTRIETVPGVGYRLTIQNPPPA
jgi:DNA-binding response OmpR family regulator